MNFLWFLEKTTVPNSKKQNFQKTAIICEGGVSTAGEGGFYRGGGGFYRWGGGFYRWGGVSTAGEGVSTAGGEGFHLCDLIGLSGQLIFL